MIFWPLIKLWLVCRKCSNKCILGSLWKEKADSRSAENISDKILKLEVQPAQTNMVCPSPETKVENISPRNTSSQYCNCTSWAKMLTHERRRDLLAVFRASVFCRNLAFCSMSRPLYGPDSWLRKTKIYVWQFRSCVQLRRIWQAITREYSRLQNARFNSCNLTFSHPEALLTFFKLLCK